MFTVLFWQSCERRAAARLFGAVAEPDHAAVEPLEQPGVLGLEGERVGGAAAEAGVVPGGPSVIGALPAVRGGTLRAAGERCRGAEGRAYACGLLGD